MPSLRNIKLSWKVFLALMPLFLGTVATIVYLNYSSQENQTLEQAKTAAISQAMTIRESVVNMMVTNERVDEAFLQRVSTVSDVERLELWFRADSLYLLPDLVSAQRTQRLKETEYQGEGSHALYAEQAFQTGENQFILSCSLGKHADHPVEEAQKNLPFFLQSCERMEAIVPLTAERKCLQCHEVQIGHVLGTVHMEIPLAKATSLMQMNAERSAIIFIAFSLVAVGIGALIFRGFVSRPVERLLHATDVIGSGNLDHKIEEEFGHDEIGKLAAAFDKMGERLQLAQRELIQKERLSTVGQMASTIIHDFRSPMTSIATALEQLRTHPLPETERDRMFKYIRTSLDRMNRMIQEILDFSRGEMQLALQELPIREFLESWLPAVRTHLEHVGIRLVTKDTCQSKALIDPDRLQRALINILNNAEDATPKGGEIVFEIGCSNGDVTFVISDRGTGIPDQLRASIFEPFVTYGKARGTGLGLAMAKKVVEQHKGEITVESRLGMGTTFMIKIPRNRDTYILQP